MREDTGEMNGSLAGGDIRSVRDRIVGRRNHLTGKRGSFDAVAAGARDETILDGGVHHETQDHHRLPDPARGESLVTLRSELVRGTEPGVNSETARIADVSSRGRGSNGLKKSDDGKKTTTRKSTGG